jgi:hypothetical protein
MKRLYIVALLFLVGCANNPYSRFYNDNTGGIDVTTSPLVVVSTEQPKLSRGNNVDEDCRIMRQNGYELLGNSSFWYTGTVNEQKAIAQAKTVHAEQVIVYVNYRDTQSGVRAVTLPDTKKSTTKENGTVFGGGGMANYSGSSTTTTYGTKTSYVPYTVDRYDYLAMYWVKCKPPRFGAYVRELNPEERELIGSNKGVVIDLVVNGSPAFSSDVLVGDIIRQIGTAETIDGASFTKAIDQFQGTEVEVLLLRNGAEVKKQVRLNSGEEPNQKLAEKR